MVLDSKNLVEDFIKILSKELKDTWTIEGFQTSERVSLLNKMEDK